MVSGDVLGSLFLGKQEQHLGVGWGFSSWRPFILSPPMERTNKVQCWGVGEGWLPKTWSDAQ